MILYVSLLVDSIQLFLLYYCLCMLSTSLVAFSYFFVMISLSLSVYMVKKTMSLTMCTNNTAGYACEIIKDFTQH